MRRGPALLTLREWDRRYREQGLARRQPAYGGRLGRHVRDGDERLLHLAFDDSAASLDLWNFLLTEEARLHRARRDGLTIVGAMKDLGTVPVMAFSLPDTVAFYPDGAWWIPCVMQMNASVLRLADSIGIDESFCPVRAMLGAFMNGEHFPVPDLLTCSAGAVCDDFSAIAQRLEAMGHPVLWWEMPRRRRPVRGERGVTLPGGFTCPGDQVALVESELGRVRLALEGVSGHRLTDRRLIRGIREANRVRRCLAALRESVFTAPVAPLPSLEMLIAEMFAIHFCSDRGEALRVLSALLGEVRRRIRRGVGFGRADAVRVFWVNPVADIRAMNLLEACGGRICGTEYLFSHALDEIPELIPPMQALARMALADPMVGPAADRAARIAADAKRFGAEVVIVSRIPGASHCALEGPVIHDFVGERLGLPVIEIEVPSVIDPMLPTLKTRLAAAIEMARGRRRA